MSMLIKLTLGPVLLAQGLMVRSRAVRLPEPAGARHGTAGQGAPLRLLLLGDSAAAGVGAAHQDDALLGQLVAQLAAHYRVTWTLHARIGATSSDALKSLDALGDAQFDVVVTSLGVNDVTTGRSQALFLADQKAIVTRLKSRFRARLIVLSGLPPVHRFPLLPEPLRWYLGREAKRFDRALEDQFGQDRSCAYFRQSEDGALDMMASDGFHPGPPVYARWARLVADLIQQRLAGIESATENSP